MTPGCCQVGNLLTIAEDMGLEPEGHQPHPQLELGTELTRSEQTAPVSPPQPPQGCLCHGYRRRNPVGSLHCSGFCFSAMPVPRDAVPFLAPPPFRVHPHSSCLQTPGASANMLRSRVGQFITVKSVAGKGGMRRGRRRGSAKISELFTPLHQDAGPPSPQEHVSTHFYFADHFERRQGRGNSIMFN